MSLGNSIRRRRYRGWIGNRRDRYISPVLGIQWPAFEDRDTEQISGVDRSGCLLLFSCLIPLKVIQFPKNPSVGTQGGCSKRAPRARRAYSSEKHFNHTT
jgi:hypothetical protein